MAQALTEFQVCKRSGQQDFRRKAAILNITIDNEEIVSNTCYINACSVVAELIVAICH
jgi:hypothetical protein